MEYKKEDFLSWLRDTYDIEFNDKIGIVDKFFEWLNSKGEMANTNSNGYEGQGQKPKSKDEDGKPLYGGNTTHFIEETDDNGRVWYKMFHFCCQPDEARHLKEGDAIVYKRTMCGVETTGFLIISSFDFGSDFAARAFIGKLPYVWDDASDKHVSYTYYNGFAPSFERFSLATEDEIEQFMVEFKKNNKEYNALKEYYHNRCEDNEELNKYVKYFE